MSFDANDPRWTAYVLGELKNEADRAEIEAHLNESGEAQRLVEEIRQSARLLGEELQAEPAFGLVASQRQRIDARIVASRPWLRLRNPWILASMATAATLVIVVLATGHRAYRPGTGLPSVAATESKAAGSRPVSRTSADSGKLQSPQPQPHRAVPSLPKQTPVGANPQIAAQIQPGVPAQAPRPAEIFGVITDASGAVIPGAEIQVRDDVTGTIAKTVTVENGTFTFPHLDPGSKTLIASMPGFKPTSLSGLKIEPNTPLNVQLTMQVAASGETVTVQANAENVRVQAATIAAIPARPRTVTVMDSVGPALGFTPPMAVGGNLGRTGGAGSGRGINYGWNDSTRARRMSERARAGFNTEAYDLIRDNPFLEAAQNPLSTFSIDVNTASYANVRRFLNGGSMPPKDAVRIEELINYFDYGYASPTDGKPLAAYFDVAEAPWNPEHRLLRIGIKARELKGGRPASNLVFLLDVSGSMGEPNKLPLVKESMRMLVNQLTENDKVGIVTYSSEASVCLPPISGDQKDRILAAIEGLHAGGSTNGGSGIQLAYQAAQAGFVRGGVNRVILATDGDFNVGITNRGDLTRLIEDKAKSGIFLTALGFGMGNYKDATLESLADKGDGNYAYIDSFEEARKVFVEQLNSTLVTVAKDVKIQIEFNPAQVGAYRLIGYEDRALSSEDFNDDAKDAGDAGAGHAVTALYELVPPGGAISAAKVDPLKYQHPTGTTTAALAGELATLKVRYKEPVQDKSDLLEYVIRDSGKTFAAATADFKFAAAVAAFGMVLRDSPHKGNATLSGVLEMATSGLGTDRYGYRQEFVRLIQRALLVTR